MYENTGCKKDQNHPPSSPSCAMARSPSRTRRTQINRCKHNMYEDGIVQRWRPCPRKTGQSAHSFELKRLTPKLSSFSNLLSKKPASFREQAHFELSFAQSTPSECTGKASLREKFTSWIYSVLAGHVPCVYYKRFPKILGTNVNCS